MGKKKLIDQWELGSQVMSHLGVASSIIITLDKQQHNMELGSLITQKVNHPSIWIVKWEWQ